MTTFKQVVESLENSLVGKTSLKLLEEENVTGVIWNGKQLFKSVFTDETKSQTEYQLAGFNLPPDGSFDKILNEFGRKFFEKTHEIREIETKETPEQYMIRLKDATVIFGNNGTTDFLNISKSLAIPIKEEEKEEINASEKVETTETEIKTEDNSSEK